MGSGPRGACRLYCGWWMVIVVGAVRTKEAMRVRISGGRSRKRKGSVAGVEDLGWSWMGQVVKYMLVD